MLPRFRKHHTHHTADSQPWLHAPQGARMFLRLDVSSVRLCFMLHRDNANEARLRLSRCSTGLTSTSGSETNAHMYTFSLLISVYFLHF